MSISKTLVKKGGLSPSSELNLKPEFLIVVSIIDGNFI